MAPYMLGKPRTSQPVERASGESHVDFVTRTRPATLHAVASEHTIAEKNQAMAIAALIRDGSWRGTIPAKLQALVSQLSGYTPLPAVDASGAARSSIARQVEAGFASDQQPHSRKDLGTDTARQDVRAPVRPALPYRLAQVRDVLLQSGLDFPVPEDALREALDALQVSDLSERLAVLVEANQLGLVASPSGQEGTRSRKPHAAHNVVVRHQQSASSGKRKGREMQAACVSARGAYACYDNSTPLLFVGDSE